MPLRIADGFWSLDVDTAGMDRGELDVKVRALDQAGNTGEPASLSLLLDNTAPKVDLPESWHFTQTILLVIRDSGSGIRRAELRINCGEYGTRTYVWRAGQIPETFTWDRRVGEVIAPPGEYAVSLEAWDKLGNHRKDSAVVVIPSPPTITPTSIPFKTQTPEPKPAMPVSNLPTLSPSPEPEVVIPVSGDSKSVTRISDDVNQGQISILTLSTLGSGAMLLALAISGLLDRRYKALRDVSNIFNSLCKPDDEKE
jgi:hypothetical protein